MSFTKYSQDADRLGKVLEADEGFRHLGRAEIDVLNACAGTKLEMEKGEEAIDVCLAIEEMKQNAAKIATEEEQITTLLKNIKNLMKKAGWSAEQSMDVLDVSEKDRKELQPLIQ